jgi:hypothetical protein
MKNEELPKSLEEFAKSAEKVHDSIRKLEKNVMAQARRQEKRYKF